MLDFPLFDPFLPLPFTEVYSEDLTFHGTLGNPQDISEPQWNQDEYLILHAGSPHVTDSDPLTQVERWLAAEVLPHDVPCGDPLIQPTSYTESFPLSSLSSSNDTPGPSAQTESPQSISPPLEQRQLGSNPTLGSNGSKRKRGPERIYVCGECSKVVARIDNFRRHLRELHGIGGTRQKHPCPGCSKELSSDHELKKHMKERHNILHPDYRPQPKRLKAKAQQEDYPCRFETLLGCKSRYKDLEGDQYKAHLKKKHLFVLPRTLVTREMETNMAYPHGPVPGPSNWQNS
ncbi:hypothetical protein PCASD_11576 [Puccinia coronata f. sp. avenae]|uniref:C2H2-type domain-containing protein n=1 Tax=Puccinia coronata f. sp. avenae TaxID=200324 RepID=A0A2N5TG24_9BASI|nr:hypothetical protein PCASD_11576 [Puccinia coronata f. sp. avenae]